ncbi:MAG: hypothetical protein ACOX9A_03280 [Anaerolineae bacterium]|jgi:hypothetical protein
MDNDASSSARSVLSSPLPSRRLCKYHGTDRSVTNASSDSNFYATPSSNAETNIHALVPIDRS